MRKLLLATDADWIHDDVDAALADEDTEVVRVRSGVEVEAAVREHQPSLVVLDLQIGTMGGVAACLYLRQEQADGRMGPVPVMLLLDRLADIFLAHRSGADGWLIKPLDALRLRRAATALMNGDEFREHPGVVTVPAVAPTD